MRRILAIAAMSVGLAVSQPAQALVQDANFFPVFLPLQLNFDGRPMGQSWTAENTGQVTHIDIRINPLVNNPNADSLVLDFEIRKIDVKESDGSIDLAKNTNVLGALEDVTYAPAGPSTNVLLSLDFSASAPEIVAGHEYLLLQREANATPPANGSRLGAWLGSTFPLVYPVSTYAGGFAYLQPELLFQEPLQEISGSNPQAMLTSDLAFGVFVEPQVVPIPGTLLMLAPVVAGGLLVARRQRRKL